MGQVIDISLLRQGGAGASLPLPRAVGRLEVGWRAVGRQRLRRAACACGWVGYLPEGEIAARAAAGGGCGRPECSVPLLDRMQAEAPARAVELQLAFLLADRPQEVASCWGGAADDAERLSFEAGAAALVSHLSRRGGGLWLCRRNPALPYLPGNVALCDAPEAPFDDPTGRPARWLLARAELPNLKAG